MSAAKKNTAAAKKNTTRGRLDLSGSIDDARAFLAGPAAAAADTILEESGVLSFGEAFDDAIEQAMTVVDTRSEEELHATIDRLGLVEQLDSHLASSETRRTEIGFLIGVAVGLRLRDGAR